MCADTVTRGEPAAAEKLSTLEDTLRDCRKCGLCEGRTQVVFGVGSPEARLLFVGEGPGFHEDKQGEPFVGQAGKLLNELLAGIGLERAQVYIANVVKCRPPENRDPTPQEIEACSPHLFQQIEIIRPQVICTLGRFATRLLTGSELSITAIHGKAKEAEVGGVPVLLFPVFHPAAALYTPANRKVLEEDFGKLRVLLDKGMEALVSDTAAASPEAAVPAEVRPPEAPASAPAAERTAPAAEETPQSTEQLPLW